MASFLTWLLGFCSLESWPFAQQSQGVIALQRCDHQQSVPPLRIELRIPGYKAGVIPLNYRGNGDSKVCKKQRVTVEVGPKRDPTSDLCLTQERLPCQAKQHTVHPCMLFGAPGWS